MFQFFKAKYSILMISKCWKTRSWLQLIILFWLCFYILRVMRAKTLLRLKLCLWYKAFDHEIISFDMYGITFRYFIFSQALLAELHWNIYEHKTFPPRTNTYTYTHTWELFLTHNLQKKRRMHKNHREIMMNHFCAC